MMVVENEENWGWMTEDGRMSMEAWYKSKKKFSHGTNFQNTGGERTRRLVNAFCGQSELPLDHERQRQVKHGADAEWGFQ